MNSHTIDAYDAIVIGSGQGGNPLATAWAEAGRRTALIEREHVGGTCINSGCTPTKTMIASARVAHVVSRASDYGVQCSSPTVNLAVVRERKRAMVDRFRTGALGRLQAHPNLDLIRGEASFLEGHHLSVTRLDGGTQTLSAPEIFINTGTRPRPPNLPGAETVPVLDSTTIMELDTVPSHLLIVGGGYVGLEFGQMFRRFGSQITLVQRGDRLLPREEPEIAEALAAILREEGIALCLGSTPVRIGRSASGAVRLDLGTGNRRESLQGDALLWAAGRIPNADRLSLTAAGIETDDRGFLVVDERLETSVHGVYALGDVKGGPAFTHISYDDFRILKTNLLEGSDATTTGRQIPYTLFTDPQLGRIGWTEQQARDRGLPIRIATMPMSRVARALEVDESRGLLKAVVHADTGRILGASILGIEGGELMTCLQIAMLGDLPYTALRDATFAHPTLAESLNNLFSSFAEP